MFLFNRTTEMSSSAAVDGLRKVIGAGYCAELPAGDGDKCDDSNHEEERAKHDSRLSHAACRVLVGGHLAFEELAQFIAGSL